MNGNGVGSYGSIKKKVSESMLGNRESNNNKKIVTKIVKRGKSKKPVSSSGAKKCADSVEKSIKYENDLNLGIIHFTKIFNMISMLPFYSFEQARAKSLA